MRASLRPVLVSLTLVVGAVVLQTTLFGPGRLQPFGAAPNLVLLVVIACARYLDPEPALLVGFTGGLLMDLLSGSPLGLWAMVMTAVAYAALRLRRRAEDSVLLGIAGVFLLTVLGQVLFVTFGTFFGQRFFEDPALVRKILLPAVYNAVLAPVVFWGVRVAIGERRARSFVS